MTLALEAITAPKMMEEQRRLVAFRSAQEYVDG
jgi:hypothetical protein